ncbi:MAG: hypothetical protein JWL76_2372 [Thermoleophilia bacterium]|nr:hypothetical protein [Thermoleophilia bacterium]
MARHHDGDPVVVRGSGVATTRIHDDAGIAVTKGRFGGLDIPATLTGALVAVALLTIIGGLVAAAIGGIGYQLGAEGLDGDEIGWAAVIGGLATVFLSFLAGGWAAGRIARYDGVRNGVMVAVWVIVLGAVFAGLGTWLGSEYDVLDRAELPRLDGLGDDLAVGAVLTALATLATMLLASALGGRWGTRFHRRADESIANTREGAVLDADRHMNRGIVR